MLAFHATADWAPREGYTLNERERRDRRALLASQVFRNVDAAVRQVDTPRIGPKDVLVEVGACGVCGTDLHVLRSDREGYTGLASHMRFPLVLGHEFSGEVVEVGAGVTRVQKGDLIAVEQIHWCGECPLCKAGLFNQCLEMEEVGLSCDGGFAEYAVVPEKYCCPINDLAEKLGDRMAALEAGAVTEPTCVAYNGMVVGSGGFKPGSHVAVFGAGPIGLAAVALARAFGAGQIFCFSRNAARGELARRMGADHVVDADALLAQGGSPVEIILQKTGGVGAGMVVEATGSYDAAYPLITGIVTCGGCIVQLGVGGGRIPLEPSPMVRKAARFTATVGQAGSDIFPSVLRMMAAGRIDMRQMVTGRFALADADEVFRQAGDRTLGHGKVLVSHRYAK